MEKSEIIEIVKMLKSLYPQESFSPEDWYAMFKDFSSSVVKEGVREWYRGDWGYRAPLPRDIHGLDYVAMRDPDGLFMMAIRKNKARQEARQKEIEESLEEIRV